MKIGLFLLLNKTISIKNKMKKIEKIYSQYSIRVIYLIGYEEELKKFHSNFSRRKGVKVRKYDKEEFYSLLKKCRGVTIRNIGIDIKKDMSIFLVMVKIKKDYISRPRDLYRTAFHEARHVADRIAGMCNLSLEDYENMACLQSDIDLDVKDLIDSYLLQQEEKKEL